jgi:hypothetical protein
MWPMTNLTAPPITDSIAAPIRSPGQAGRPGRTVKVIEHPAFRNPARRWRTMADSHPEFLAVPLRVVFLNDPVPAANRSCAGARSIVGLT